MDQLREMKTMICVTQTRNFSAAARQLGTSRSTVTKVISGLEQRLPAQIIAHAVWLYVRFDLSLREVEEMLLERGIDVSYETIRRGPSSSGRRSPGICDGDRAVPATSGTWTKSS